MQTPAQLRELLLNYRLHRLSPAERERVEERIFREAEFSAKLEEAEYDLLDDYHNARLFPDDRARVEEAFSAAGRARTILLRAPDLAVKTSVRGPRFFSPPMFTLSFGALLVVVALGLWLHGRQHPSPSVAANVPKSPQAPATAQATSAPLAGSVATLLLTPEVPRDASALDLVLMPQTKDVRVQWVLPAETHGSKFELTVTTRSGAAVLRAGGDVSLVEGQRLVEFSLPAAELPTGGGYQFTVRDAHRIPVREYRVTVVRR